MVVSEIHQENGKYLGNNDTNLEIDEGKSWPQILAIMIVSLGFFTTGCHWSWSSPFAPAISKDKIHYNISEEEASYFIVVQPSGMLFASLFFFKIAEYLGRKKSVVFLAIPQFTAWIITIFATTKWHFYMARFIAGIGDAVAFCSIPPYVGEVTTPRVRGYWGNYPTLILYSGQFGINALGSYVDVKSAGYILAGLPIIFATLVTYVLPESPYELIRRSKHNEAKESIKWLLRKPDVEDEFLNMKFDVERQMSESGNWMDLLRILSNRRAVRAGIFLRFSQQFSGVSVFASYSQVIFQKSGSPISPEYSSMIFLGMMFLLNLLCSISIEKYGRKVSYFYSIIACGIILLIMAVYFSIDQYDIVNLERISWFPLAGMITWVVAYSPGLGVVPTLMLGELFSASIKSKGLCILIMGFGIAVFITTNIFNLLTSYIGIFGPFLVYGIICLISAILTLRWVPETKGRTLEEIQQDLKK